MKHPHFKAGQVARRDRAIAERLIQVLEDGPKDRFRRVCPACGAGVVSYMCRPRHPRGAGEEILRCEAGFDIRTWRLERNWMWEGLDG
jgi:hypothetical protein